MRVTLKDVAREAGVTAQTVSAILGAKRDLYREETQRQVLAAAARLNYRPNVSARAMRSGRFGSVGLLQSDTSGSAWMNPEFLDAFHDEMARGGYNLIFSRVEGRLLENGSDLPRMLTDLMIDGLLLHFTGSVPSALASIVDAHRLPAVWLNRRMEFDCVYADNRGASERLVRQFAELGRARIMYLDHAWKSEFADEPINMIDRRSGYLESMSALGLQAQVVSAARVAPAEAWEAAGKPDAVIVSHVRDAMPLAIRLMQGSVSMPDDVALVGFGGGFALSESVSPFQILEVDERLRAEAAAALLLSKIERPRRSLDARCLRFGLRGPNTSGLGQSGTF